MPGPVSRGLSAGQGDATGGLIPYKNIPALMAYYFGVFSIIPFFPIGIAAFVLGIVGLKRRKRNPIIRGAAHAWIGIIVGGLFGLIWTVLTFLLAAAAIGSTAGGRGVRTASPAPAIQHQAPISRADALRAPSQGGVVAGTLLYTGQPVTPVNPSSLKTLEDRISAYTDELVVNPDGSLCNVLVYVKGGLEGYEFSKPRGRAVINATEIDFFPHVLAVQADQPVEFRNCAGDVQDWIIQGIANSSVSLNQPKPGMTMERTFAFPEVPIRVTSRLYPSMGAYICIIDNPFFNVTGPAGVFRLEGLPPGTYVIESWHESLGTTQQTVTVREGALTSITIKY